MKIRIGYDISFENGAPTPMIFMLNVHPSRAHDLVTPDRIRFDRPCTITPYVDSFGNKCVRVLAPAGQLRLWNSAVVADSGLPDSIDIGAREHAVSDLPSDTLMYLLPSRYCETDLLMDDAWNMFGGIQPGWKRIQAVCDFVNERISFGYENADIKRTAIKAFEEGKGVCRDYAHLAIALCRCLNIPARYATGYLGDIGVPADPAPMDFSAWFEAYVGGRWHTFDARHNKPRIGRVLIARGRDAADVAISTSFGPSKLISFEVTTQDATQELENTTATKVA